jgi:acid phosphatase
VAWVRHFTFLLLWTWGVFAAPPVVTVSPREGGVLRFAVVGDAGEGAAAVARGISRVNAAKPLDAIILPGDNVYPCGVKSATDPRWSVLEPLIALQIPLFPVLGNHDYCGNPDAQIAASERFAEWRFPAREYMLQGGVADFAMIDTTPYVRRKTRAPDVAAMFAESRARWRIVVGHHTIVSSGYHGYLPRGEHRRMLALLKPFRAAHIDLYICGHDHHLELVDGRPRMLISGAASDPIGPVALHPHTLYPASTQTQGGFAVVEVTAERMTVTFFDLEGRRLAGEFTFRRTYA